MAAAVEQIEVPLGAEGLAVWQERYNTRRHLATLDQRMLEDVGLSRADVAREVRPG